MAKRIKRIVKGLKDISYSVDFKYGQDEYIALGHAMQLEDSPEHFATVEIVTGKKAPAIMRERFYIAETEAATLFDCLPLLEAECDKLIDRFKALEDNG